MTDWNIQRLAEEKFRMTGVSEWEKFIPTPPTYNICDICPKPAIWRHPLGGFRCGQCRKPGPKCTKCFEEISPLGYCMCRPDHKKRKS